MSKPDPRTHILQFLADQPDGACRMGWLPDDISFFAYRALREDGHLEQQAGPAGFEIVSITRSGRRLLAKSIGQSPSSSGKEG